MKMIRLKDKFRKLYSIRKNGKTIFQLEDCGDYIRLYPLKFKSYRNDKGSSQSKMLFIRLGGIPNEASSFNGRTSDFDSDNGGSTPSLAANKPFSYNGPVNDRRRTGNDN